MTRVDLGIQVFDTHRQINISPDPFRVFVKTDTLSNSKSYPRTSSYALSISTLDQQSSSNKSSRRKQTKNKVKLTEPFYVDLHPPSDSTLGYRMKNNKQKNSGSEMLIKALGIKKMISDKMNNEANDNREEVIFMI